MENNLIVCDYASCCKGFPMLREHLNPYSTHEQILEYFLTIHNQREFMNENYEHMMMAYKIKDKNSEKIFTILRKQSFELPPIFNKRDFTFKQIADFNKILRRSPLKNLETGGILLVHGSPIVDYLPDDSLIKQYVLSSLQRLK